MKKKSREKHLKGFLFLCPYCHVALVLLGSQTVIHLQKKSQALKKGEEEKIIFRIVQLLYCFVSSTTTTKG